MRNKYVVIEGLIGAGKTTLAKALSERNKVSLVLEEFMSNAFLAPFYKDPERYAFPVEVGFLTERFRQLERELAGEVKSKTIIADYHFEKSMVFARQNLTPEHLQVFQSLFDVLSSKIGKPDLMIYLDNSTEGLLTNIWKRKRDMEKQIKSDYLEKLQASYLSFLNIQKLQLPILMLDMSELDFVKDLSVLEKIEDIMEQDLKCRVYKIPA